MPITAGLDGGARLSALVLAMYGYPSPIEITMGTIPKRFAAGYKAGLEANRSSGRCWVLLGCLWPILGLCCPPGVALGLCSLYFRFMLDHLETMLGFVGSNAAPRDAAICQSCSCWCSCCASGCSCFCSRCLRGCCAVEVVDVVGAVLCGASRNMLVCCVCCFVARTVLMSL